MNGSDYSGMVDGVIKAICTTAIITSLTLLSIGFFVGYKCGQKSKEKEILSAEIERVRLIIQTMRADELARKVKP